MEMKWVFVCMYKSMYVSCNFCYSSFPLWSILSPPVDVQLKGLNPLCWAYTWLIFLKVKWWQNTGKTMSISTLWINRCKLVPKLTVLCTHNFTCMNVHTEAFYMHENQYMQILNWLSSDKLIFFTVPLLSICSQSK